MLCAWGAAEGLRLFPPSVVRRRSVRPSSPTLLPYGAGYGVCGCWWAADRELVQRDGRALARPGAEPAGAPAASAASASDSGVCRSGRYCTKASLTSRTSWCAPCEQLPVSTSQCSQVFESETYGRVLVLDGCIQLTQRDEFSYQARRRGEESHPLRTLLTPEAGNDGPHPAVLTQRPATSRAGGAAVLQSRGGVSRGGVLTLMFCRLAAATAASCAR